MAKKTVKKDKEVGSDSIEATIKAIQSRFGDEALMKLGEKPKVNINAISTGSLGLDMALGIGGVPRGRIVEIYGPESSGKTTLALHIIAEAQKKGGVCAFIDAEHAMDPEYSKKLGVQIDNLLISQPDYGEQALEIVETLIRSGALDVIVIDSVAALVPRAEIEGEMGDAMMGVQARLMSQALRKITGAISKSHTVVIFINQLRMKIGVMFGNPETTTGGMALKFYSSVRVDTRKIETLKDGDKVIGSRHRARIVKNKVASPFSVAEFDILNDGGISKAGGLIDVGLELGILTKKGAFIYHGDAILGQGREAVRIYLNENPKVAKQIEDAIWKTAHDSKKALPKQMGEIEEE